MATALQEDGLFKRTLANLFSGLMGGIANCLTGHPFDTLKVRLQTQSVTHPVYKGLTDCFVKTINHEGIGGLYKGVGSPLVGQMFNRATLFASYYQVSSMLSRFSAHSQRSESNFHYFICGGCAGFVASFVEGPIDLFKTKMQVQVFNQSHGGSHQYRNVFHAGWLIGSQYGIRGIYQGLAATWLRNIPSFALYFGSYEIIKEYFSQRGGRRITLPEQLLAGATAGLFYWIITYPTDVIKSSMQSDHMQKDKRKYQNVLHCAKTLYTQEGGWQRFYRGYLPCIMRTVPASASMLLVMEQSRKFLSQR